MMIQNSSELAAQLAARIHNPARTHNLVGPKTIRSKEGKRNEYSTNEYGSPLGSDGTTLLFANTASANHGFGSTLTVRDNNTQAMRWCP